METLRISPKYTSSDWAALDRTDAAHWPKAVAIVRDRLHGRFLHFADKCLKDDYSGFVVLSIDCLLVVLRSKSNNLHSAILPILFISVDCLALFLKM